MSVRPAREKRVTRERAAEIAAGWRARGETVVFAWDAFDLLDVRHVRALARARSLGDRLIVGVSGDRATAERLGPGRPVLSAEHRAALVAALRAVDLVIEYEESSPDRLREALGRDIEDAGGEMTGGPDVSGAGTPGTSSLFARIRARHGGR